MDDLIAGAAPAEPSLGLDLGAGPVMASPYRVLARKYRPSSFADLIGQEAMVRTLANSFKADRIHQAYILTGVRGVGKTTTARILARAFNYSLPGKIDRPSVEMPELGVHCQAIMDSRHIDVIEMDAASHTGIDDVREIIENARYRPVSARTKVYIVDEVHMLSKQAFNGLLKTLEEPPEHVKFLFATTEIEKVPITVRSRCIRFDLKRIESGVMMRHLEKVCAAEGVLAEPDALALIARVAEGSVRDALSLLDQGIAHGAADGVRAADIRGMLGLSDRGEIIDLFVHAMKGEIADALALTAKLHHAGADAAEMLIELAEFCHFVTRVKLAPSGLDDPAISEIERRRGGEIASQLALGPLTRAWQILLKGVEDVKDSPRPLASAEMAIIRLAYAADLPSPEDALRKLAESPESTPRIAPPPSNGPRGPALAGPVGSLGATALRSPATAPIAAPAIAPSNAPAIARFEDVVALARGKRDIQLCQALERDVRLLRFEPGRIEFSLIDGASSALPQTLSRKLAEWTGERWMVALAPGATAPTLRETANVREAERLSGVAAHPLVRKVLERFPGAKIVDVRGPEPAPVLSIAEAADDEDAVYADPSNFDDDI
jgi:DNA polymerase-3 subunit gamma/tau